jgi:hypothetical protein
MNTKGAKPFARMLEIAVIGFGLLVLVAMSVGVEASVLAQRRPARGTQAVLPDSRHASEVADGLRAAGLGIEVVHMGKREGDDAFALFPNAEAVRFRIPSEGEKEAGMILAFRSSADLEGAERYYLGLNKSLPMFSSWVFVQDNILLQINGSVPEGKARQYQLALYSLDY